MTAGEEKRARGIKRYDITSPRTYSLDVIGFEQPVRTEHVVRILDFSVVGVGVLSSVQIGSGLVYFREPVSGQKFGVIIWSQPKDDQFRAGIKFVILPPENEEYLQEQVKQSYPHMALPDPDKIIPSLLESIRNETIG